MLLTFTFPPQEGLIREAQSYIEHGQKYLPDGDSDFVCPVGPRVMHSTFGTGTVLKVDMGKGAHLVKFDELDTPWEISFKAKLERV